MDYAAKSLEKHKEWQGKIELTSRVAVASQEDLSLAYTPGVAAPCLAIQADVSQSYALTRRANLVAIVTDGTAVLGLGDIGPEAAMPVMEGKAVLFKALGNVDAIPLCIRSKDVDEIVATVSLLAGSFGAVNLEDIAAPRCFEIERRLKACCDIPIFHDDQHGTAIVVLAALLGAMSLTGKKMSEVTAIINGAGASGIAVARLLLDSGLKNLIMCDRQGAIYRGRAGLNEEKQLIATVTNPEQKKGGLADVMVGADIFIGLSAPGCVTQNMVESMASDPIIFALANPTPEIMPDLAKAGGAAIVGTGRSDFPNQINNSLAFPGVLRGTLDALASDINEEMKLAAAQAIAGYVAAAGLTADHIIPSSLDKNVAAAVAAAVKKAAIASGVARVKAVDIHRCYVEKRPGFDVEAENLRAELAELFGLPDLSLRIFKRYDIGGLSGDDWPKVMNTVCSEPMSDLCHQDELPPPPEGLRLLAVEALPGQFDIRADSCAQCVQMLLGGERPPVRTASVYALGGVGEADFAKIRAYLINPVECREATAEKPDALADEDGGTVSDVAVMTGFSGMDGAGLERLHHELSLSMSQADLLLIQEYFRATADGGRDPSLAELRVLDTYWSDHCRHTTFNTLLQIGDIRDPRIESAYRLFLALNGDRPVTLMNIATAAMRHLRGQGRLPLLDISDEINACTLKIEAEFATDKKSEPWLLFFKNETHNHPTEVEPFGGASTCIGGAIRDPLSGRAYVYQAMRISGAGDPRAALESTLPGKLPQRQLTRTAAAGFSSYGNQIGLATGYVRELYHEGYIAKRLEAGAVVGAAPAAMIRREKPENTDVVVLLGGRTGRDGIGGATGSSRAHEQKTVQTAAAEVQKGNAPEERKLQRLFRDPQVTALIKRCNDFGAGGAAVAIGELADGVLIDLDAMPVKYRGLDGTELAISESQERMAVVVAAQDVATLIAHANRENIEATPVAKVTDDNRLVMTWRGQRIVDIERAFLDKNGAERTAAVSVPYHSITDSGFIQGENRDDAPAEPYRTRLLSLCANPNFCSQKGLVERFDATIGAGSVFAPFGGKYALSESQVMAALLPVADALTASVMAFGYDPYLTEADPFGGAVHAVLSSVAKLAAAGVAIDSVHLTLQEYFPRVDGDPTRWGVPFAAMLGAFAAQIGLGVAAIGGKDSMSGSFGDLDVPPTLLSFAVGTARATDLISTEFKAAGHPVYLLTAPADMAALRTAWAEYAKLCRSGAVLSAWALDKGGIEGGILKMALGNMIGFTEAGDFGQADDVPPPVGSIIFEADRELAGYRLLGHTQEPPLLAFGTEVLPLADLLAAWSAPLEGVFPVETSQTGAVPLISDPRRHQTLRYSGAGKRGATVKPKAVIPVFPGTNCEYDSALALERAGGVAETVLIRNLTADWLRESVIELEKAISGAQMLILPGGFSGGDEPDGSAKFIVSLFRNERLAAAVHALLYERDGLILGICNGFQALIKLGLLPQGRIVPASADGATLTHNRIGRHQARYVTTRVASVLSPWLSACQVDEVYVQPISHGEGRLAAAGAALEEWRQNGQIAFQYADWVGLPTMDIRHNPGGSAWAIEGITSPDGRVLGKMAHTERHGPYVAQNIPGEKYLPLFAGGVRYFL